MTVERVFSVVLVIASVVGIVFLYRRVGQLETANADLAARSGNVPPSTPRAAFPSFVRPLNYVLPESPTPTATLAPDAIGAWVPSASIGPVVTG